MAFWHDQITEKSFRMLQDLHKTFRFILIGGWAIWVYTKTLKSKDIDIIVDYTELARFKDVFDLEKNTRLKKYEIKQDVFDIDVYVPHFSVLGLPVEDISEYTKYVDGFRVPVPEVLLILKVAAYESRKGTPKGKKDELDIISLLATQVIDIKHYTTLISRYQLVIQRTELSTLLKNITEVPELRLGQHDLSKLKKTILKSLSAV